MDSYESLAAASEELSGKFVKECLIAGQGLVLVLKNGEDLEPSDTAAIRIQVALKGIEKNRQETFELRASRLCDGDLDPCRA